MALFFIDEDEDDEAGEEDDDDDVIAPEHQAGKWHVCTLTKLCKVEKGWLVHYPGEDEATTYRLPKPYEKNYGKDNTWVFVQEVLKESRTTEAPTAIRAPAAAASVPSTGTGRATRHQQQKQGAPAGSSEFILH